MLSKKTKGEVAELAVAAKLTALGWKVLFPFGENARYDLVAEKDGVFRRLQVKYVTPKEGVLRVNCRSSNNWSVLHYTDAEIDCIAVFNGEIEDVYFIPVKEINHSLFNLRVSPTKNNQQSKIHLADKYFQLL